MFDFLVAYHKFKDNKAKEDAAKKEREATVSRTYGQLVSNFGAFLELTSAQIQVKRVPNGVQFTDHGGKILTASMTTDGKFSTSGSATNPSTGKDDLARSGLSDQDLADFIVVWAMTGPNF